MNAALQKTEEIKAVFLETQLFYATHDNMPALIEYLEHTKREFRSIAYESASMSIAIKEFERGAFPNEWLLFVNGPAAAHRAQVYVGLGWAIAKSNFPFLTAIEKLHNRLYFRVADGCGYYDGSFKRRRTVMNQELPVYLPDVIMPMYDQGVGRSIWYTEKTAIHKISSKIETFAMDRHASLWRGVGIAVAYVGGCDDADLKLLLQYAGTHSFQLACGAALAARSRTMANSMTADTNRCSRLWFELTTGTITNEDVYCNWIKEIEETLSDSFEKKA